MAVSFVASTNFAVAGTPGSDVSSITLPTCQAGDVIVLLVGAGVVASPGTVTATGGFTQLWSQWSGSNANGVFYKVAVAGDSGAVVTGTVLGSASYGRILIASAYRGVSKTAPIRGSGNAISPSGSTSHPTPAISSVSPDDFAVQTVTIYNGSTINPIISTVPGTSRQNLPNAGYSASALSDLVVTGTTAPAQSFITSGVGYTAIAGQIVLSSSTDSPFYTIV